MNTTDKHSTNQIVRVLQVVSTNSFLNQKTEFSDLIENLDHTKIRTTVLIADAHGRDDTININCVDCHSIKHSILGSTIAINKIKRLISEKKIDIIHAHGTRAARISRMATKQSKIPMVYSVNKWSFHPSQPYIVSCTNIQRERSLCNHSAQVICVSNTIQQAGVELLSLRSAKVIQNGQSLNTLKPNNESRNLRYELGIPEADFVIGYLDELTKENDPTTFIESIRHANSQISNIVGLVVDSGKWRKRILKYISTSNSESIIHISPPGYTTQDMLRAIDIFATTCLEQASSCLITQAMAMRRAIITTPADNTSEFITDEFNGKIVPFRDSKALAEKYIEYYNEPQTVCQHTQNGAARIATHFNCAKNAKEISKTYLQIAYKQRSTLLPTKG